MVTHQKMNLFDAPPESIIVHACNSQGVWGSGIAKPFKEKYPFSFAEYHDLCNIWNQERGTACGVGFMSSFHPDETHHVGWIVTSHDYGPVLRDKPELIKINTTLALQSLCKKIYLGHPKDGYERIDVYSNKFNSGLFHVPWEDSELILSTVLRDFSRINWIVCDPEAK
jgi:ADP-ribose 1''-phosphate phosphatase